MPHNDILCLEKSHFFQLLKRYFSQQHLNFQISKIHFKIFKKRQKLFTQFILLKMDFWF